MNFIRVAFLLRNPSNIKAFRKKFGNAIVLFISMSWTGALSIQRLSLFRQQDIADWRHSTDGQLDHSKSFPDVTETVSEKPPFSAERGNRDLKSASSGLFPVLFSLFGKKIDLSWLTTLKGNNFYR